jgi:hypothetical protein
MFVLAALSPGARPISSVDLPNGVHKLNFNVFSCIGIAGGIWALFFLPRNARRLKALPPARRVLGLIGAIGLLVHLLLVVLSYVFPQPPWAALWLL